MVRGSDRVSKRGQFPETQERGGLAKWKMEMITIKEERDGIEEMEMGIEEDTIR